jgi:hypothetical protein
MATSTPHRAAAELFREMAPLDHRPHSAALAAGGIAGVGELAVEQPSRLATEPRHARLLREGRVGRDPTLAAAGVTCLELKRRFEPEG